MRKFEELKRDERDEIVLLFANWLNQYTHEVIVKVIERRDEIINNEFAMNLLKELKEREEKEKLLAVVRNIPFTIPFCVPADLLTGAIGIVQGIISMVILMIFSVLVIMLSGRIYKGLVLYTGQKISWKNLVGALKNKN